jgi:hypothetical protein
MMRPIPDPVPPDFPRTLHDISGHSVGILAPYREGDTIGKVEVVLLQRAIVDLVRANLCKRLKELPRTTDPALIRQAVDDFTRDILINPVRYFGPTSKPVRAQRISVETMNAAIEMIRARIDASKDLRFSDFSAARIRVLAIELIETQPHLFTLHAMQETYQPRASRSAPPGSSSNPSAPENASPPGESK